MAVINNGNLGMVRQWQTLFYGERYSNTDLGTHKHRIPDFVKLAEALGCIGLRCETAADVDATIETAMKINDAPVVVDFVVGKDAMVWPMVAPARATTRSCSPATCGRPSTTTTCRRTTDMSKHTLSVLVENKPGVLARVAGLFSRRGFNIDSLAVGETEHPEISRITIVVNAEDSPLEQVTKQLNKLVNVLKIVELEPSASVQRELLLVKVRADRPQRSQVLETVQLFRARVVDVSHDALTVEATGTAEKLEALLRDLEPYGIKEMVQSGMVAIGRGSRSITAPVLRAAS